MSNTLVIAKYLVKNNIINPIIKKIRRILLFLALLFIIIIIVVSISFPLFTSEHPEHESEEEEEFALRAMIVSIMNRYGLTKNLIIDIFSILLLLMFSISLIQRENLVMVEEAEYEVLLAQPISMSQYLLGRYIYMSIYGLIICLPYFGFIPLAFELNGGNQVKVLILPLVIFSSMVLLFTLDIVTATVNMILKQVNARDKLKLSVLCYWVAGIIHSVILSNPSPLITYPLRPFAESIIYCFSRDPLNTLTISVSKMILIHAIILVSLTYLSKYFTPEYIKPMPIIFRERQIKIFKKIKYFLDFSNVDSLVRGYILGTSILNSKHIRNIIIAYITIPIVFMLLKYMNFPLLSAIDEGFIMIFLPIFFGSIMNSLIAMFMGNDLSCLWVYRVYMADMYPLAKNIIIKYVIYLTELFIALGLINACLFDNYLYLLLPIATLPFVTLTSIFVLTIITFFMSRRKVVKQTQSGLYMIEDVTLSIIWCIVLLLIFIAIAIFNYIINNYTYDIIIIVLVLFIVASAVIYRYTTKFITKRMMSYDIL